MQIGLHARRARRATCALLAGAAACLAWVATPALAIEDRADVVPNEPVHPDKPVGWKLSLGRYRVQGGPDGEDLNLRGNTERLAFWVGGYRQADGFRQARAGAEWQQAVAYGRVIASAQAAAGGFLGASLTWELPVAGEHGSVLLGWGRTNTRPYVNLNFDPNDSLLVGGSWRIDPATQLTIFHLWDDRLGTGQRITHAVIRREMGERNLLTVDVFDRRGRTDADSPWHRGGGLGLTWDRAGWFVRVVRDASANYDGAVMTRLSVGLRF